MSGGKSKTSSTQQQETTQLTSDGVIVGDLFQGKTLTVNQEFGEDVAGAFGQLINLAGDAISAASDAGGSALNLSSDAIAKVSDRASFSENPEIQTLNRYLPFFMLSAIVVGVYFIARKK